MLAKLATPGLIRSSPLKLAHDLREYGAAVWLDQLDIHPGERWDVAIEQSLAVCPTMLVLLSPQSVNSTNVMDEVAFALEERKLIVPVLYQDCKIPFRLRRLQYIDARGDYKRGMEEVRRILSAHAGDRDVAAVRDKADAQIGEVLDPARASAAAERAGRVTGLRKSVGTLTSYTWLVEGQIFPVREGRTHIGSGDMKEDERRNVDVYCPLDDLISDDHAEIFTDSRRIYIRDLSSTNGTFVNGSQIRPGTAVELLNNAEIRTGKTIFIFLKVPR